MPRPARQRPINISGLVGPASRGLATLAQSNAQLGQSLFRGLAGINEAAAAERRRKDDFSIRSRALDLQEQRMAEDRLHREAVQGAAADDVLAAIEGMEQMLASGEQIPEEAEAQMEDMVAKAGGLGAIQKHDSLAIGPIKVTLPSGAQATERSADQLFMESIAAEQRVKGFSEGLKTLQQARKNALKSRALTSSADARLRAAMAKARGRLIQEQKNAASLKLRAQRAGRREQSRMLAEQSMEMANAADLKEREEQAPFLRQQMERSGIPEEDIDLGIAQFMAGIPAPQAIAAARAGTKAAEATMTDEQKQAVRDEHARSVFRFAGTLQAKFKIPNTEKSRKAQEQVAQIAEAVRDGRLTLIEARKDVSALADALKPPKADEPPTPSEKRAVRAEERTIEDRRTRALRHASKVANTEATLLEEDQELDEETGQPKPISDEEAMEGARKAYQRWLLEGGESLDREDRKRALQQILRRFGVKQNAR